MIIAENLSRTFKRHEQLPGWKGIINNLIHPQIQIVKAVESVYFEIESGEFIGYIGPNGAGKSTTIKMLTGILTPTSGSLIIDGLHPATQRKQHALNIGVVFGQRSQLWWDLPIEDSYLLFKHMYKIDDAIYSKRIELLQELMDMKTFWHVPVRQLSLGQRMRGELGAALLHNPKILFLDEPTIGMDVVVKEQVKMFLGEINRTQKVTILLTTHDLKDIEDLCSRVILINKGKLLYDGSLDKMRKAASAMTILIIEFDRLIDESLLTAYNNCEVRSCEGKRLVIAFQREKVNPMVLVNNYMILGDIIDIKLNEPPIEEIVHDFYL